MPDGINTKLLTCAPMENYGYNLSYPESGNSSPRSREIEFENPPLWEDSQGSAQLPPNFKVKFMCSYGGKIHPRPHDNLLSYIGGETKILAVDRSIKFASLLSKLIAMCDDDSISFKYQLPGEDLDSLISVTNDDDMEHMMQEHDRLYRISPKPARLRIFIFPSPSHNPSLSSSIRSFGSEEGRSEKEKFVEALNSAPVMTAPPQSAAAVPLQPHLQASNVDFLFGLEKATAMAAVAASPSQLPVLVGRSAHGVEDPVAIPGLGEKLIGSDPIKKHIHDLQRLRLEEQQQATNYRRKSEDNIGGGINAGEYYRVPEKVQPVAVPGVVPYWTEKQFPGGVCPTSTMIADQQIYMIPAPASAYHAPTVRQVSGVPTQGYYTAPRMPSGEVYREQQQMYNMIPTSAIQSMPAAPPPSMPPQKVAGFSESFGIVRQTSGGGVGVTADPAYGQVAYDGGIGRQVIYSGPPGGVMGARPAPYQAVATAVSADMRAAGGALITEAGGKVVAGKATQASV